jgi:ATP-dependent DNA ligase
MKSAIANPQSAIRPPTYPARPVNGGPLPKALPKSGEWFYEPKYNGWRAIVHIPTGSMFNRKLERLSIASEFKAALDQLRCTLDAEAFKWADCEALERRHGIGRGTLIVLDVVPDGLCKFVEVDNDTSTLTQRVPTYLDRRRWLEAVLPYTENFFNSLRPCGDNELRLAPRIRADCGIKDKTCGTLSEIWQQLQAENWRLGCQFYEGLVAKRADSPYPRQLRNPELDFPFWVKHRWAF